MNTPSSQVGGYSNDHPNWAFPLLPRSRMKPTPQNTAETEVSMPGVKELSQKQSEERRQKRLEQGPPNRLPWLAMLRVKSRTCTPKLHPDAQGLTFSF